jgi:hypothetical protein|tara:strand:+ start:221 stop:748 length:528 start_codon:yes stop_codon:yes gene_type:complete
MIQQQLAWQVYELMQERISVLTSLVRRLSAFARSAMEVATGAEAALLDESVNSVLLDQDLEAANVRIGNLEIQLNGTSEALRHEVLKSKQLTEELSARKREHSEDVRHEQDKVSPMLLPAVRARCTRPLHAPAVQSCCTRPLHTGAAHSHCRTRCLYTASLVCRACWFSRSIVAT